MMKKLMNHYRVPLLSSLVICIVLLALRAERDPLSISLIVLGSFFGTFILDLDYLIYAYFTEPSKDFSKNLRAFLKHHDYSNALNYLFVHKDTLEDNILNSVLFQGVLAGATVLVVATESGLLVQALVISAFVNSIYRMYEYYFKDKIDDWFWAISIKMTKNSLIIYTSLLFAILIYSLSQF